MDVVRLVGGIAVLVLTVPGAVRPRARAAATPKSDVMLRRPGATRFVAALVSGLGAYMAVSAFTGPHDSWLLPGAVIALIPAAAVSLVLARVQGVGWAFGGDDRPPEYMYGPPAEPAPEPEARPRDR